MSHVLIRVHSWTEWIPQTPDGTFPDARLPNGITGFEAGEEERLVDVRKNPALDPDGNMVLREGKDNAQMPMIWALFSFQATLAQTVSDKDFKEAMKRQPRVPKLNEQERDRRKDLIIPGKN